jgi:GrpB-like predicted nucleotidyltransferase (UPF0157 family)
MRRFAGYLSLACKVEYDLPSSSQEQPMPPAFPVELVPHDPRWAEAAEDRSRDLRVALGALLIEVHHVGSTSIPGILAKPILDLIPEVQSLAGLDLARPAIEGLGYEWWGELGLPGRRYCTLTDQGARRRLVQLHCYETASPEIARHLAFRDHLRQRPDLAAEYEALKQACRAQHPESSHAYSDCKADWIRRVEAEALSAVAAF